LGPQRRPFRYGAHRQLTRHCFVRQAELSSVNSRLRAALHFCRRLARPRHVAAKPQHESRNRATEPTPLAANASAALGLPAVLLLLSSTAFV
jgi:hypothetical protein